VKDLPIVSPHGHTDPQWYADNEPFSNASALFITPDHYVFRMLYSQGVRLEDLAIPIRPGATGDARVETDARRIWRTLAAHYRLFRGTPTRIGSTTPSTKYSAFAMADDGVRRSAVRSDQRVAGETEPARARCSSASTSK
jgi:hypothetical protein